jgi:predicted O-methyltransferase YrrM
VDDTANYIASFLSLDNIQLEAVAHEEMQRDDIQPSIGPEVGKLLGLLIRLMRARRVLEMGTCLGYSTIWLAQALQTTGGKLVSIEYKDDLFEDTRRNIALAGLTDVVELIKGDARVIIEQVHGPFDMILQDSDKNLYPLLLERSIALTRQYGIIVADDALFKPRGIPAALSEPMHDYNQRVFADTRLYSTILPIGDGVTISVKLCD